MKIFTRVLLSLVVFISSYFFIFWVPFSIIPGAHTIVAIPFIVSFIIALVITIKTWKKTAVMSNSLPSYLFKGGVILGSIGFILGFFGPMILTPSANQGPMLGLFITGPISFVVGVLGGGIYWRVKVKNK